VTCVVGAPPTEGPARESQIMTELVAIPHAAPTLKLPPAVRLSSGVTLGMLISKVEPQYPALARQARVQGDVFLAATIDRNGRIENLRVLSGHPMLVQAAVDAVKQWRYRPYMLGNEPVEVETQVTVRFRLN
jgi:protein TonB